MDFKCRSYSGKLQTFRDEKLCLGFIENFDLNLTSSHPQKRFLYCFVIFTSRQQKRYGNLFFLQKGNIVSLEKTSYDILENKIKNAISKISSKNISYIMRNRINLG